MERAKSLQSGTAVHAPRRGKVMVVEQDRKDLMVYTGVLRRMGFDVRAFSDFAEALRCLRDESADFVFVNQGGTAFQAREVVQSALERNRHTPVVVLAQSLHMGCYLEAMQLGAVDYVEKPLAPAEMEHLVTTHWQPQAMAMRRSN